MKIKKNQSVDKSNNSNPVKYFDLKTKLVKLATTAELTARHKKTVKVKEFKLLYFRVTIILKIMDIRII